MSEPKETAETFEEAMELGFAGEAIYPSPYANRGTLRGVTVNSNDSPTPFQITGPGADVEISDEELRGT